MYSKLNLGLSEVVNSNIFPPSQRKDAKCFISTDGDYYEVITITSDLQFVGYDHGHFKKYRELYEVIEAIDMLFSGKYNYQFFIDGTEYTKNRPRTLNTIGRLKEFETLKTAVEKIRPNITTERLKAEITHIAIKHDISIKKAIQKYIDNLYCFSNVERI